MEIVMLASILIPLFTAVVVLIVSKILLRMTFKKINRINMGWEKLYKKLLRDGWVPPETSKWFHDYVDHYHPEYNPSKCWVLIVEEEKDGTS